ncbi:MAG: hypothetical protein JXR10_01780 [Cyclobacteriaceae bacterium]
MNKNTIIKLWALSALIFFSACESDDEPVAESTPATLNESTKIFLRQAGDLRGFIGASGLAVDTDALKYGVTTYKVTYETNYKGNKILASAMVFLPETEDVVSTISFQHGTIASNAEAPSQLELGSGQIILASAMSSAGHVVVLPDFIGFGESVDVMHPYYVEDLNATDVIDAIYASRQVALDEGVKMDNELYLAGYSQGGYVTMAVHKHIEEKGIEYYDLKASFPSSGGYDVKLFQEYFFALESYHQPFFLAYVANSYKESYDWDMPLDLMFKEPYATEIPSYFDGSLSGGQINAKLDTLISGLLQEDLLSNPNDAKYSIIMDAFEENSLTDWVPQVRMFMYHGDADITVPYQNSVAVYNEFIKNGASESVVTFEAIPGGTHGTGVGPWIESFVGEIQKMEAN